MGSSRQIPCDESHGAAVATEEVKGQVKVQSPSRMDDDINRVLELRYCQLWVLLQAFRQNKYTSLKINDKTPKLSCDASPSTNTTFSELNNSVSKPLPLNCFKSFHVVI